MEDNLKKLKVEYFSNHYHLLDHTQILNLSFCMPMGVLAPGSAHATHSARPPTAWVEILYYKFLFTQMGVLALWFVHARHSACSVCHFLSLATEFLLFFGSIFFSGGPFFSGRNFFRAEFFWAEIFFGQKFFFRVEIFFGQKFFGGEKKFRLKIFFWATNLFQAEIFSGGNLFWGAEKNVGRKFFSSGGNFFPVEIFCLKMLCRDIWYADIKMTQLCYLCYAVTIIIIFFV